MVFYWITVVLQIACLVHAFRNRKEIYWFFIIFFFPGFGSIAYIVVEVLPEMQRQPSIRSLGGSAKASGSKLKKLRQELEFSPTIENRLNLADAHLSRGEFSAAVEHYRESLRGQYANDPYIRFRLAEALYREGNAQESLDLLISLESDGYRDYRLERQLQKAMCLDGLERTGEGIDVLSPMHEAFPGEEASYEYGRMLAIAGRREEALAVFGGILGNRKRYEKSALRGQSKWFRLAREAMKELKG